MQRDKGAYRCGEADLAAPTDHDRERSSKITHEINLVAVDCQIMLRRLPSVVPTEMESTYFSLFSCIPPVR